jgi:uncharacterized protein
LATKKPGSTAPNFQKLLRAFDEIGFQSFHDEYRVGLDGSESSDLPTANVWLTQNGATKSVSDYDHAPPELRDLEARIERTANVHRWIHDKTKQLTLGSPDVGPAKAYIEDLKNEHVVITDSSTGIKPTMSTLMQAAGTGNLAQIRESLRTGEPVDAADDSGWTALMIASVAVRPEAVDLLLKSGAHVDQKDGHGNTALIGASAVTFNLEREPEVLRMLLSSGAKVDNFNHLGETAIMWAAKSGNAEGIALLLKSGANPLKTDRYGHDAMYYWTRARRNFAYDETRVAEYDRAGAVLEPAVKQRQRSNPQ